MYKFLLCTRYLTSRKIGLVSIISVMLGVTTLIVVNSVMGGFRSKMRDRLHGILADVIIDSRSMNGFPNSQKAIELIEQEVGDEVVAIAPVVEVDGLLQFKIQMQGSEWMMRHVRIIGVDPKSRAAIGDFAEYLGSEENQKSPSFELTQAGKKWRSENPRLVDNELDLAGCIVGYQIATHRQKGMTSEMTLIAPGHEVVLTTVNASSSELDKAIDRFVVTDTYHCEMSEYDATYVFVPIEHLQKIRGMDDRVTSLQIKLKDPDRAGEVAEKLAGIFDYRFFMVGTWEDKQGPLLHAVRVEGVILNIILFFIIAVAGFGILATFFMIVVEKTKDIGILKALGASKAGVMEIFLGYGLSLGVVGCLMGVILGIAITLNINNIEQFFARNTGWELFPKDVYYFKEIPVKLEPATVVWVTIAALGIAVAAAVWPAIRASKLHPVEALRYE